MNSTIGSSIALLLFFTSLSSFAIVVNNMTDETTTDDYNNDSDTYRLYHRLFSKYNKFLRPVRNASTVTIVELNNQLRAILNTNEREQTFNYKEWFQMYWFDEYLTWNPLEYGGIDRLLVPRSIIWNPDVTRIDMFVGFTHPFTITLDCDGVYLFFDNIQHFSIRQYQPLSDEMSLVSVSSNGYVMQGIDQLVTVYCEFQIIMYPFDTQNCSIHFETWESTIRDINLTVRGDVTLTKDYMDNNEWQLMSYSTRREEYSYTHFDPNALPTVRIWYDVVMRRRPTFYVFAFILPCFIVIQLSLVGLFTKSTDGGQRSEKVTMGLTSLLSLAILLLMISADMPKTSDGLPLLGIYIMIEICFGAIATITAVYMTHLQSGWMYGAPLPHYLMRCVGNQILFEPNSPFNDSVLIHQKYDHTLTEKDEDDVIKKCAIIDKSNDHRLAKCRREITKICQQIEMWGDRDELCKQWTIACATVDRYFLIVFLVANTSVFIITLLIGYWQ